MKAKLEEMISLGYFDDKKKAEMLELKEEFLL